MKVKDGVGGLWDMALVVHNRISHLFDDELRRTLGQWRHCEIGVCQMSDRFVRRVSERCTSKDGYPRQSAVLLLKQE